MLRVRNLRTGYNKKEIVHGIDFTVERGEFACMIGANGCGKTTTLKGILGLLPLQAGTVCMGNEEIINAETGHTISARERARIFAYIPQIHGLPFPFVVSDVVLLGRTPYLKSSVAGPSNDDRIAAYRALEALGIESIAGSVYTELSGGQQQLVLIARALAQEPQVLIMDEPTASLDYGNQQMVLNRVKDLTSGGMSVVMVTHDPHHVLLCADNVIVMRDGNVMKMGTPDETITTKTLSDIFGVKALVASVQMEDGAKRKTVVPA